MIKVVVNQKEISIMGHAMYDAFGKDIVCAACSSIVTTSINGILRIDKDAISYQQLEDGIVIHQKKEDDITSHLLLNMIDLLKELEESYPKNISVK